MTDGSDGESTDTEQLAASDSTVEFMIGDEVLVKTTQEGKMPDTDPSDREREVTLTLKAREKAHRLYNEYELRDRVHNQRGTVFRKGESDEYHLVQSGRSIVVVVEDDGSRTVITQMHDHPDYHYDNRYQQIGEIP